MQDWMRKHRRLIMFFVLIFIGIPFVFMFGMPAMQSQQDAGRDTVIAEVGGVPLMESEFRRNLDAAAASRAQQAGERPTYQELDADGTVQRVLEQMIDSALIRIQENQRDFYVQEPLLAKQMQQWEIFQDEAGNFKPQAWNEWVESIARWDEIYDELREAVSRQVFLGTVMAPAKRVLDSKIEEELRAEHTKLRIRYAKAEPTITPTEEEIRTHYEENPDTYRLPEQHQAEFIAIPLTPDMPELASELVERARAGEDFAALATEYSDLTMPEGGDMGWRGVEEYVAPHLEPLLMLEVGEVSDPVQGPTGFFIYKNEDERTNPETGAFEIRGRQIVLHANLDEATRAAREQLAEDLAAELQGAEAPETIAEAYGFTLQRTDFYNRTSTEIQNILGNDLFQFRTQSVANKEEPWKPITTQNNILLSRIIETREGDIPPLDEVRERAAENIVNERKRTEAYQEEVAEYAAAMKGGIEALEDIETLFPELDVEIGETEEPFSRQDMLFEQQIYVQTTSIHEALKDAESGDVAGPLSGFFGDMWFVELVERIEPSEDTFAELEDEREELRERLVQTAQYELLADYTQDLRERMLASVSYSQNTDALDRILGREWEEPTATPAEADDLFTFETPIDAPASEDTASDVDTEPHDGANEVDAPIITVE